MNEKRQSEFLIAFFLASKEASLDEVSVVKMILRILEISFLPLG